MEGAKELILAIFRLAVADYMGHSYSHDLDAPIRTTSKAFSSEAETFLKSASASYFADLVGLEGPAIWREARRLHESSTGGQSREAAA